MNMLKKISFFTSSSNIPNDSNVLTSESLRQHPRRGKEKPRATEFALNFSDDQDIRSSNGPAIRETIAPLDRRVGITPSGSEGSPSEGQTDFHRRLHNSLSFHYPLVLPLTDSTLNTATSLAGRTSLVTATPDKGIQKNHQSLWDIWKETPRLVKIGLRFLSMTLGYTHILRMSICAS